MTYGENDRWCKQTPAQVIGMLAREKIAASV
jgi:hypothetical protein